MQTSFQTVFDGMSLVVATRSGRELKRLGYTEHQSPFSPGRTLTVPPGVTTRELRFPKVDWPGAPAELTVRLEGGLPGTAYDKGLKSNSKMLLVKSRLAK